MSDSILFPLRQNTPALVAGAPVESVRRRVKLACLLYERVFLEAGTVKFAADEGGSVETRDSIAATWQTPSERRRVVSFTLRGIDAAPDTPPRALVRASSVNWRGTFEPFKIEIPRMDGVDFVEVDWTSPEVKKNAREVRRELSGYVGPYDSEHWVRQHIAEAASGALAWSAYSGAAVSLDQRHAASLAGYSGPLSSDSDLETPILCIQIPQVAALAWDDVARLRADRGIRYWRDYVRETAEMVRQRSAGSGFDAGELAATNAERYRQAESRLSSVWPGGTSLVSAAVAIGSTIGMIAVGVPPPVGVSSAVSLATTTGIRWWRGRRSRLALAFESRLVASAPATV